MKKIIFILLLFIICKANAQDKKFNYSLHYNAGFSNIYKTDELYKQLKDLFVNRVGMQISYNVSANKHFFNLGLFHSQKGFYTETKAYTDSLLQNEVLLKNIYYNSYIEIPISYTYYILPEKPVNPFFEFGISNYFLYKTKSKFINLPENLFGKPISDSYLPKQIVGIINIQEQTISRIYNIAFYINIGTKIYIYKNFYTTISLNYSSNLLSNIKDENIFNDKNPKYFYFYGINLSFGF